MIMQTEDLMSLIEKLTGKPLRLSKEPEGIESDLIKRFLSRKQLVINWNEFNEILLICNKDRVSRGFFDFFFRKDCTKDESLTLQEIEEGIENFRTYAILIFGNFIFAYRTLTKYSIDEIKEELKSYLRNFTKVEEAFKKRPREIETIYDIEKRNTYFVGYLSGKTINTEWDSAKILQKFLMQWEGELQDIIEPLSEYATINPIKRTITDSMVTIASKYLHCYPRARRKQFKDFIGYSLNAIEKVKNELEKVRKRAEINTDIYLTWDYIDVYLATSMREKYEYKTFYEFVKALFNTPKLKSLNLRYFDPTKSFEKNRIDKGLIEGLMLKRAKCTIYSVQETDTLGKDSELAATLAQGKPVIAYIPEIDIEKHADFIKKQSLTFLKDKIDLLSKEFRNYEIQNACRKWLLNHKSSDIDIAGPNAFNKFIFDVSNKILEILHKKFWDCVEETTQQKNHERKQLGDRFEIICNFIAIADKFFYDKRHDILKNIHPLGIQINLANGVANGVLLVRNIKDCSRLLYNILTNRLKSNLILKYKSDSKYWYLEEEISKCVYRVVTEDVKITNSFWNFYLLEGEE